MNKGAKQQAIKLAIELGMPNKAKQYLAQHNKNTKEMLKRIKKGVK